jgi:hypothetical protein
MQHAFRHFDKIVECLSNHFAHFQLPQSQSHTAPVRGHKTTSGPFLKIKYYRSDTIRFRDASCAALKQTRALSRPSIVHDVAVSARALRNSTGLRERKSTLEKVASAHSLSCHALVVSGALT